MEHWNDVVLVPDSTLMIGDIIASGATLIHCLHYVTDFYCNHGARLRNIILFTMAVQDVTRSMNM